MKALLAAFLAFALAIGFGTNLVAADPATTAWSPLRKPRQADIWGESVPNEVPRRVRDTSTTRPAVHQAPVHQTPVHRPARATNVAPTQHMAQGDMFSEVLPELHYNEPSMMSAPMMDAPMMGAPMGAPMMGAPRRRALHPIATPQPPCDMGCATRGLFAEFLYLRPGNDKVGYGVPIDGAIVAPGGVAPIQIRSEATVDPDFSGGFRVGGNFMLNPIASLELSYTQLEADDQDSTSVQSPFVLRSLVAHPGTQSAATDFLSGSAQLDIRFDLIDVAITRELHAGPDHVLAWHMGSRFANLEQQFTSSLLSSTRQETVTSEIDFQGAGITLGLRGARRVNSQFVGGHQHGWSLYGKALASFLAGNFDAGYRQRDNFTTSALVDTGWEEDRVVPILDLETGVCWTSRTERFHLSAGYMFSAWYNVITTDSFVDAVQDNASATIDDTMTFDGFVINIEYRF
jgi:hypothetical protein